MASIIQGTDSSIVVSLGDDVDLSAIEWFEIRIVQGGLLLTKSKDDLYIDLENKNLYVPITREDSFKFSATAANLQIFYRFDGESKTRGTYPIPFRIHPMISPASYYEEEEEGSEEEVVPTDNTGNESNSTQENGIENNNTENTENTENTDNADNTDGAVGNEGDGTVEVENGDVSNG